MAWTEASHMVFKPDSFYTLRPNFKHLFKSTRKSKILFLRILLPSSYVRLKAHEVDDKAPLLFRKNI